MEVCGVLHSGKGAPWLRRRDQEIQAMDQAIVRAKQADTVALEHGTREDWRRARHALQLACKHKVYTHGEWETARLSHKAAEAKAALGTCWVTDVFKLVKELRQAVPGHKRDR